MILQNKLMSLKFMPWVLISVIKKISRESGRHCNLIYVKWMVKLKVKKKMYQVKSTSILSVGEKKRKKKSISWKGGKWTNNIYPSNNIYEFFLSKKKKPHNTGVRVLVHLRNKNWSRLIYKRNTCTKRILELQLAGNKSLYSPEPHSLLSNYYKIKTGHISTATDIYKERITCCHFLPCLLTKGSSTSLHPL